MDCSRTQLSRRGTLLAGAGLAAAAGLGLTTPASAATARPARHLTPRQLAGQRVIFSYPGPTVPQSLLDAIAAGECGGVILFGENVTGLPQITAAVQQLHDANRSSPVDAPLLVMTDQEGGLVRRLPGAPVLSAKQIGASADPAATAASAGHDAGLLLRGAGVNLNLAPVLDVFRTPGDFDDQFQRSFSSDPEVVATCGRSFIGAQQAVGVAATAKHFPGLGPATAQQNTDLGPVTLTTPLADLRSIDEHPYTSAIAAGVKLVMVSWAIYTNLDPGVPAAFSPRIIHRELRRRHRFEGVTVTDAINAGAISAFGTPAQNAVTAARAGMDLILEATRDVSHGQAVVEGLASALDCGDLARREFEQALHRIVDLRNTLR
ncbi:beta-N-acetylhexosaminidase [Kitasatospora sp. GAS204A]|uniref:glycoside hydrolase family 3 N-terminal domain-containing protein n=1 Tax=unclassified Kitasatospora TaxID=2633591 RepID=UPI0024754A1A|nr:glycoside hydrolase family 3 N-terminal domain-containing protein [Kitasatospora sp. GAS204B]MDH6120985.1 beta-N-acetylhexosaminidase [Kitasatospora sp. GAS204B]